MNLRIVILETPYKGDNWENTEENLRFARLCMRDCLLRGEAPYASHLLYTQEGVLDDKVAEERRIGMEAGFEFKRLSELSVIYVNRGVSGGMRAGIRKSIETKQGFEYRLLPDYPRNYRTAICTVSGASGVGKSTIVKMLLVRKAAELVKSHTTRPPRTADLPGEYKYDVPAKDFDSAKFLWVVSVHGNLYGTSRESIQDALGCLHGGLYVVSPIVRLMILTPDGVEKLRLKAYGHEPLVKHFYILSPGEDLIRKRLASRGDDGASIDRRVKECQKWDRKAIESDTPYIFIQNDGPSAEAAVSQISLFF